MSNLNRDRTIPSLLILLLLFYIYAILKIIITPPAEGHEIHIFDAIPEVRIILIFNTVIAGTITLWIYYFSSINKYSWKSTFVLLLSLSTFLLLPLLRGYFLIGSGSADTLAHIGYVKDIEATGSVSDDNWYPIIHILIYIISTFGVEIEVISQLHQIIFFMLYLFGIGLFLRAITSIRGSIQVGIVVSSVLIYSGFHFSTSPSISSFWLFPLLLFILTINSYRGYILMLMLSFAVVFFHPASSVILVIILMVFGWTSYWYNFNVKKLISLTAVAFITFAFWLTFFPGRQGPFLGVLDFFGLYDRGEGMASSTASGATNVPLDVMVLRLIESFATIAIYAGIALFSITLLVILGLHRKKRDFWIQSLIIQYLVSVIFTIILVSAIIFGTAWERTTRYLILISTIIIGTTMALLNFENDVPIDMTGFIKYIFIGAIVVAMILSMATAYDKNMHFSESEYNGASWVTNNYDKNSPIYTYGYSDKIIMAELSRNLYTQKYSDRFTFTPVPQERSIADLIKSSQNGYLITTEREKDFELLYPTSVREERELYNESDIQYLMDNSDINRVYHNPEANIWTIENK